MGFVLEKHGAWYLEQEPSKALSEGDRVPAGAKIRPREVEQKEGEKCSLTVCFYTGQAKVYTGPATLPDRVAASPVARLCRAMAGRQPTGYVHAISRGNEVSDGVVRLENGQVDLAPIFHAGQPGEYQVEFKRASPSSANTPPAATLRFVYDAKRSLSVAAVGLSPGLFECAVLLPGGRPGAAAWVLVSEPSAYAQAAEAYRQAVTLSEAWDPDVSPYAIVSFRRACLKTLAEPIRP